MGCACKRPYLCAVLILGSMSLLLHLAGFMMPGWLIMRKSIQEVQMQLTEEIVAVQMPLNVTNSMSTDEKPSLEMPGPNLHGPVGEMDLDTLKEYRDMNKWIVTIANEVSIMDYKIQISYGLWYSTICIQMDKSKVANGIEVHSSDKEHDKKRCSCRKVPTKCALGNSWVFEDPRDLGIAARMLSEKNFGHASLMEHRIENAMAFFFMILGLISAIVTFRKPTGSKCVAGCCSLFMLLAAILVIIPAIRLALYSQYKDSQAFPVSVHAPYSVIASGLGAILAFITAIVAAFGTVHIKRVERPGRWYQLNNQLEVEKQQQNEKKSLVFLAEPLPEKLGLYVDCEFGIVVLEEGDEPKKVPLK